MRGERRLQVVREHPGLQAIGGVIHGRERGLVGVRPGQYEHRPEHLLDPDLGVGRHIGQHRGRVGDTVTDPAGEQPATASHRLAHPRLHPAGSVLIDHRADVGAVVGRITRAQRGDQVDHELRHPLVVRLVHDDPLHRDAALSGLVVGERSDPGGRPDQVRLAGPVGAHHRGGITSEFQRDVLTRHRSPDLRSHRAGAGERDHRQARISHQLTGPVVGHRQDREQAGGQVGLAQQVAQQQRRQRGGRRGFQHDRRAHRDRRRDLVRDQVQRKVERADAQYGAARKPADQGDPAGRGGVGVQSLQVTGEAPGLLGGPAEGGRGPANLGAGPFHRLAVLRGDEPGDLLGPVGQPPRHMLQRRRAYMCGQRRGTGRGLRSAGHGPLDLGRRGEAGPADLAAVIRVPDDELVTLGAVLGLASHVDRLRRGHAGPPGTAKGYALGTLVQDGRYGNSRIKGCRQRNRS